MKLQHSSSSLHQQLGFHINWVAAMVSSKNNQLQMSYSVCTWKKHKYSSKCGFKYNQGANHFSSMWSTNKKSKTKWRHFATISIWHYSEQKLSWESYKSKHQQTQVQKASGELLHSQQRKHLHPVHTSEHKLQNTQSSMQLNTQRSVLNASASIARSLNASFLEVAAIVSSIFTSSVKRLARGTPRLDPNLAQFKIVGGGTLHTSNAEDYGLREIEIQTMHEYRKMENCR